MIPPKQRTKEEWDKFCEDFMQDMRRANWHSRYAEPTEAMYGVIAKHGDFSLVATYYVGSCSFGS